MSLHAVAGHQPHLTTRGVTFSAGSGASRPRVAVAVAPLPRPTAGPPAFPLDLLPAGYCRNHAWAWFHFPAAALGYVVVAI